MLVRFINMYYLLNFSFCKRRTIANGRLHWKSSVVLVISLVLDVLSEELGDKCETTLFSQWISGQMCEKNYCRL